MLTIDYYTFAKGFHVAAALTFVSGVLLNAILLTALPREQTEVLQKLAVRARRWDNRVTTPAMVATWILGFFLGSAGGWFSSGWLIAKLGFVFGLSALHGMLSARLRLAVAGRIHSQLGWSPAVIVGSAVAIALLATTKI